MVRNSFKSRLFSWSVGILAILVGFIALLGWFRDIPALTRFYVSSVMMKANAALGITIQGLILIVLSWIRAPGPTRIQKGFIQLSALFVMLLGALTVIEFIFRINLGIDQILARDVFSPNQTGAPGRMSINTAFSLMFLGLGTAILFTHLKNRFWISQGFLIVTWLIGLTATVGYIYGVSLVFQVGSSTSIAPQTAILLFLLPSALIGRQSNEGLIGSLNRGSPGRIIFWRQLTLLIIVTLTLGAIRVWGQNRGYYSTALGTLIYGISQVIIFLVITWRNIAALNRFEDTRGRSERDLRRFATFLDETQAVASVGSWEVDLVNSTIFWTSETYRIHETTPQEYKPSLETAIQFFAPECRSMITSAIQAAVQEGKPYSLELDLITAKGRRKHVQAVSRVIQEHNRTIRLYGVIQDITTRKLVEQERIKVQRELHESQERLAFALDAGRIGILDWTLQGSSVRLNDIGLNLIGFKEGTKPSSFSEIETRIHADDKFQFRSSVEISIRTQNSFKMDFRVIWPDGTICWLHARGRGFYDSQGIAKRLTCALIDITNRKKQENQIMEILQSITSGFFALDRNWYFKYVNSSGERLLQKKAQELLGKDLRDVFPELMGTSFEENCRKGIEEGKTSRFEVFYPSFRAWFELAVYPSENGLSVYFDDITERKIAEARIVQLSEQRQLALNAARLGWWHFDAMKRITTFDNRFGEIFELSGNSRPSDEILALVHQEDLADVKERLAIALNPQDPKPYFAEYRIHLHGKTRWIEAHGIVQFEGKGKDRQVIGMIGTLADITERRQAEIALKENDAKLRELLASERVLLQKAEQAIRARDDVMTMVSHDLKNPIGAVLLNTMLLERKPFPPEGVKKRAEIIAQITRRMDSMVKDILDVAKIESGTFAVELAPEEVLSVFQEAFQLLSPLAKARKIKLNSQVPKDCCPLIAVDKGRIIQVLSNLVGNALKFTPEGGTVSMAVERRNDGALFVVKDTGAGIAPEHLPYVFDRFWQASHTAKQGTGFGLAIVKGIVEAHGGKIFVESKLGEGTTFYFNLRTPEALPHELQLRLKSEKKSA